MDAKFVKLPSGAYELRECGSAGVYRGTIRRFGAVWLARRPRGEEVGSFPSRKTAAESLLST